MSQCQVLNMGLIFITDKFLFYYLSNKKEVITGFKVLDYSLKKLKKTLGRNGRKRKNVNKMKISYEFLNYKKNKILNQNYKNK